MKLSKKILSLVILAACQQVAYAAEAAEQTLMVASDVDPSSVPTTQEQKKFDATSSKYEEKYFSGHDYVLSPQEQKALQIAEEFRRNSNQNAKPIAGKAGEIIYVYGAQSIDVVCAVLQVCDIALQPGEQINTLHLGDNTRWMLDPAVTGVGEEEVQHIIVKPLDVGLKTNLIVTTNRRTYHINLGSHRTKYMPLVSFAYPDEINNRFSTLRRYSADKTAKAKVETGESIDNLYFDYDIASNGQSWTPVRVYNNGRQTVIELPKNVSSSEIPTFTVRDSATQEDVLVNYRYIGNKFIVDAVFQQAVLIVGVGSNQQKITITKR